MVTIGRTSATATGLTAGNYNITVTDANNCSIIKYFTIVQPDALTAVTSQTNILCNGSATGSANVTPSGGAGNYTYTWLPTGGTSATATNLTAGYYNVTITDANNCSVIKYFTITQPDAITAATSQTNILCNGSATGSANVTPSGGIGTYTYAWLPTGGTLATATNLTAGYYNVTITDANNCSIIKYFTITQPDALTATTSQTDALCNNSGGTASVTAQGGTGSYTYAWLPSGGTNATATGLAAGDYNVIITDTNNCSITKYFTILQSAPVEVTASQTNVLCNGGSTGTATVTPTNSAVTYTYLWSPTGSTNATATGLVAGDYNVTVTNADNCSIVHYFTITEPDALTASQFQYGINCNGGLATAGVTPTGGSGTYTYVWTPNVGNEAVIFNLGAGDYNVVITDANGCNVTKYFTITEPVPLTATTSQLNINCTDTYSGTASVTPSGGSGIYTYSWSPYGGQEATATGLSDGDYTVIITDSNNCNITKDFTITRPANVDVEITQTAATCTAAGTATAIATGGSGNFSYLWSPFGGNAAQATGLATGQYNVTITDNVTNCNTTRELYISGPEECMIATSWNGSAWSNEAPDCVTYSAEINGDYNSAVNGEITACSLTVNSGTVIVAGGDNFIIKGSVIVAGGSLTFNDNANLVQIDYGENIGEITYNKNSSALYNLDYTIWSSPVTGSQTLKEFSPQTSDSRFYVYNTELGAYSNYTSASGIFGGNPDEVTFNPAKGYLIRMPEGSSGSTPTVYNGSFTGVPNNGYVSIPLNRTGSRYNAVGNPYPSPINVKQFILQNQFDLDNGTLYFWRKRNGGTGTSYATVTLAGYVAGTSEGGDTSGGAFNDGDEANWVINPAQGFLVKASEFATSLTFTNSMRKAVNNNQFFRTTAVSTDTSSKLWLNISNDVNEFGQAAIAYTDMTTLDIDYGYDGRLFNDGQISVYTIAQNVKLAIQARAQFNEQDEVIVGYKATNAGNYSMSLDHFTGTFLGSQDIYLKDNLLGITHNIKQSAYTFTTDAGTFNDRFSIVYTSTLGVAVPNINLDNIIVYQKENVITVNSSNEVIKDIHVYDLQGRLVYMREGINKIATIITDLKAQKQMLVIQVATADGNKVSKKIIY